MSYTGAQGASSIFDDDNDENLFDARDWNQPQGSLAHGWDLSPIPPPHMPPASSTTTTTSDPSVPYGSAHPGDNFPMSGSSFPSSSGSVSRGTSQFQGVRMGDVKQLLQIRYQQASSGNVCTPLANATPKIRTYFS